MEHLANKKNNQILVKNNFFPFSSAFSEKKFQKKKKLFSFQLVAMPSVSLQTPKCVK